MKILLFCVSYLFGLTTETLSDPIGTYAYTVNTPNGLVSGEIMLAKNSKGDYEGSISAYGQTFEMTDVVVMQDALHFKTAVSGYISTIKGKFEGNFYVATIYVEGVEIPLKAEKVK